MSSFISFWSVNISLIYSFSSFNSFLISPILSVGELAINCRTATKARMMPMFTSIAISELRTLLSMATPNSVKAKGIYLLPPLWFEVQFLHLKLSNSSFVNSNMKSDGNRFKLFFTERFKYFVSVPYNSARSKSSMTFCPRIS